MVLLFLLRSGHYSPFAILPPFHALNFEHISCGSPHLLGMVLWWLCLDLLAVERPHCWRPALQCLLLSSLIDLSLFLNRSCIYCIGKCHEFEALSGRTSRGDTATVFINGKATWQGGSFIRLEGRYNTGRDREQMRLQRTPNTNASNQCKSWNFVDIVESARFESILWISLLEEAMSPESRRRHISFVYQDQRLYNSLQTDEEKHSQIHN